jgi:hypothetical protein
MAAQKQLKQSVAIRLKNHPEFSEICSKLIINIEPEQIVEWLEAKYASADKSLLISKKDLTTFRDEYLDFYNQINEDARAVKNGESLSVEDQLQDALENDSTYRQRLQECIDDEVQIKTILKGMIVAVEARAMQVFDAIQRDNRNMRNDKILIEWFNTLTSMLEKYEKIVNGSPTNVINQNNINIQIVDQQINVFHKVIRDVLSRLDYDTSLLFIDLFNEELTKVKEMSSQPIPVDIRLDEAKQLQSASEEIFR